jgi:hypothetical protein
MLLVHACKLDDQVVAIQIWGTVTAPGILALSLFDLTSLQDLREVLQRLRRLGHVLNLNVLSTTGVAVDLAADGGAKPSILLLERFERTIESRPHFT